MKCLLKWSDDVNISNSGFSRADRKLTQRTPSLSNYKAHGGPAMDYDILIFSDLLATNLS